MYKPLLLSALLLVMADVSAKIYQWKDENGNMHYSDKPPRSVQDEQLKIRSLDNIRYSSSTQNIGERVVIYSTVWCPHCKKAKRFFRANNIPFIEYDIEKDPAARKRYDKLQGRGVPLILVGKKRMNGFSKAGFKRMYKQQG